MSRTMQWAARPEHLGGIPRKLVIAVVGTFAKTVASLVNTTSVHNADTLLRLVRSRPPGVPLITVSNHMSTLDDPVMWGFKGFPIFDTKLARWVLTAEDICFKNSVHSYIFRVGKCIPIMRGGGIYQEHMNEALERLNDGEWVHTFPEGKVYQDDAPIRRLKWGTASLIVRAPITPIVLPIVHHGFHKVMPEKKSIFAMKQMAISESRNRPFPTIGWPSTSDGLDEAAQRCLYTTISEEIRAAMERLRCFGKKILKS
ncbi:N-acylphosphatidylethanolamine synthase isoform X2 [Gastrolobium bilobum]|uniref:N-acylphosphatidylethanolamine synthase isoform X2 n=1 Tax=Gastrolobium bilobum TaxID=150636 RepID=UPI002AB0D22C|nr:N-acylphosphatidylethanolamine synthase isoform X2 [Gastrolobium bilobum]